MPNELLSERLAAFTPEYLDFVMSDFADIAGMEAQQRYNWDDETREVFENMLFLNITLFLNRIDLVEAVILECELSVSDATTIVNDTLAKLPAEMVRAQEEASFALTQNNNELVTAKDRVGHVGVLPRQKQSIYFYVKTTPTVDDLCQKYGLTAEDTIDTCHTLLGDIILGFYKVADIVPLLQQELGIDARTAALLGADILDFLAPLSDSNFVVPVTASTESEDSSSPQQNISIAPKLHTMATDADAVRTIQPETTYRSEQPDVRKPLSDLPSYADPATQNSIPVAPIEPPRWGN